MDAENFMKTKLGKDEWLGFPEDFDCDQILEIMEEYAEARSSKIGEVYAIPIILGVFVGTVLGIIIGLIVVV